MKKFLFFISLFVFFIVPVKAENKIYNYSIGYFTGGTFTSDDSYSNYLSWFNTNQDIISNLRANLIEYYQSNYSDVYPYYNIELQADLRQEYNNITLSMRLYQYIPKLKIDSSNSAFCWSNPQTNCNSDSYLWVSTSYDFNTTTNNLPTVYTTGNFDPFYYAFQNTSTYYDHFLYETNFNIIYDESSYYDTVTINNFRNQGSLTFSKGDIVNITTSDLIGQSLTTVNLDSYDYVLLSLKDYSLKNPFQTNLQVKGQIGITPIYNYGQTSKDSITGSQVQDRCNVNYSDFTTYPFYILQTDLQNNVVYAVKACSSNSSFKYDSNIFDITYVTSQNADNPTVTIGGKTYDVIPYDDLPSTATKNEVDNYIPGQSGSAVDSGGIDSAIKGVQQGLSTLWNTFTYFTDLVGLIFSSLPVELRTILLSAFVVAITIGLIKLFTN